MEEPLKRYNMHTMYGVGYSQVPRKVPRPGNPWYHAFGLDVATFTRQEMRSREQTRLVSMRDIGRLPRLLRE